MITTMNQKRLPIAALAAAFLALSSTAPAFAGPPAGGATPPAKQVSKKSATKKSVQVVATTYACPDCHETFTAAQAKKDGMKCPFCQTKLVVAKAKPAKNSVKG